MAEGQDASFLDPAVLGAAAGAAAARAPGDARQRLRQTSQPGARVVARVRAVSQIRPRRRHAPARLAHLGPQRPLLHQGIRGRHEPPPLPAHRHQRLDGLRPEGRDAARLRAQARGHARLSRRAAGRCRRAVERGADGGGDSRRSAAPRISGSCSIKWRASSRVGGTTLLSALHDAAEKIRQRALVVILSDLFVRRRS